MEERERKVCFSAVIVVLDEKMGGYTSREIRNNAEIVDRIFYVDLRYGRDLISAGIKI